MNSNRENQVPFNDDDELIGLSSTPASARPSAAVAAPAKMGPGQKIVVALLLTAVIAPALFGVLQLLQRGPAPFARGDQEGTRRELPNLPPDPVSRWYRA